MFDAIENREEALVFVCLVKKGFSHVTLFIQAGPVTTRIPNP
jgi:hypothetical protein